MRSMVFALALLLALNGDVGAVVGATVTPAEPVAGDILTLEITAFYSTSCDRFQGDSAMWTGDTLAVEVRSLFVDGICLMVPTTVYRNYYLGSGVAGWVYYRLTEITESEGFEPYVDSRLDSTFVACGSCVSGDVCTDTEVNVQDLTALIGHLFRGQPVICSENANVNGSADGRITVSDVTHLVAHLFRGGPAPAPCDR